MANNSIKIVNEDGEIVGRDPDTGNKIPIEFESMGTKHVFVDDGNEAPDVSTTGFDADVRGHVNGYRGTASDPGWMYGWTQLMCPPTGDYNEAWFGNSDDALAYVSKRGSVTLDTTPSNGTKHMAFAPTTTSVDFNSTDLPVQFTIDHPESDWTARVLGLAFLDGAGVADITVETYNGSSWTQVQSVTGLDPAKENGGGIVWFDLHPAPTPVEQIRLTLDNAFKSTVQVERIWKYSLGESGKTYVPAESPDLISGLTVSADRDSDGVQEQALSIADDDFKIRIGTGFDVDYDGQVIRHPQRIVGQYGWRQTVNFPSGDSRVELRTEDSSGWRSTALSADHGGGATVHNGSLTVQTYLDLPPQDVRNISSPSAGTMAYHDGSGSNTEGPAHYTSGGSWVSTVDGTTIS